MTTNLEKIELMLGEITQGGWVAHHGLKKSGIEFKKYGPLLKWMNCKEDLNRRENAQFIAKSPEIIKALLECVKAASVDALSWNQEFRNDDEFEQFRESWENLRIALKSLNELNL